jgi:hypothetical protein
MRALIWDRVEEAGWMRRELMIGTSYEGRTKGGGRRRRAARQRPER